MRPVMRDSNELASRVFQRPCAGNPHLRWHTASTCSVIGVIPNRRLKSATRPHPAVGEPGEIPGPTVKVRMRGSNSDARFLDP